MEHVHLLNVKLANGLAVVADASAPRHLNTWNLLQHVAYDSVALLSIRPHEVVGGIALYGDRISFDADLLQLDLPLLNVEVHSLRLISHHLNVVAYHEARNANAQAVRLSRVGKGVYSLRVNVSIVENCRLARQTQRDEAFRGGASLIQHTSRYPGLRESGKCPKK